jgi:hypothetical protein
MQPPTEKRERMVEKLSAPGAFKANCEAIDRLIGDCPYPYIVAWGKFLGFLPYVVQEYVEKAIADNAPTDAIQKFDDGWSTLDDINNETNRSRIIELASLPSRQVNAREHERELNRIACKLGVGQRSA